MRQSGGTSISTRSRVCAISPLLAIIATLLAASALAQISPIEVIGGKSQQSLGFANGTWVAWTARANSMQAQTLSNTFARPIAGGSRVQLNPKNTQGFTGGLDPGTNTVIYQQIDLSTNRSDLYFYDLDTDTRTAVTEVNTKRWEWGPRISASYILFDLDYRKNGAWRIAIELYDRTAATTTRLGSWRTSKFNAPTASVGDTYATWTVCSTSCSTYVHDIPTGTTRVIPTKNDRPEYGAVVDETDARVYYVRSASLSCGRKVVLLRLPVADLSQAPTRIVAMPDEIDMETLSLAPNTTTGGVDLLFSRIVCRSSNEDVYKLADVSSVPDAQPAGIASW